MSRTYVVTGAGSGIGAKTRELLLAAGATVVGVDIKNADVEADLSTPAGRALGAQKAVEAAHGNVDAVIACAGLAHPIPATVSVNYFGVKEFLEEILPELSKSKAPRVAVTSSMASLMPNDPQLVDLMLANEEVKACGRADELVAAGGGMEQLIYGSTKRAVSRWIRKVAPTAQWAGAGIPINAVGPGIVDTPMVADMIATEEARKGLLEIVPMPLNGLMKPEVIAKALIWLTSEDNTHMTGQTIYIDGGSDVVLRGDNIWDLAK
jgi:NAD(P)-dependent dehydrogenase (short-subunit alcohol dehydrogenase family)